jgi:hypothetical protein
VPDDDARTAAIQRLKDKRNVQYQAISAVIVSAFLVVIWAISGAGFFWPVFPMVAFLLGISFAAFNVYGRKPISEDEIEREEQRGGPTGI